MIIKKYLVAAALCVGLSSQAFAAESVTNGGFNGPVNAWSFSSVVNRLASNVSNTGIVDTILPGSGWISQSLTLAAGTYKLAFDGLFSGGSSTLSYSIAGLTGTLTGSQISTPHNYEFSVAGGNYTLLFEGMARGRLSSFVAVDNVSVTAVPGPEAGAGLGALAMGGMAMWARRRRLAQQSNA
jgi:MYXO-CTERM domain-containing protein